MKPAEALVGLTLSDGWVVKAKRAQLPGGTGSLHSHGYLVTDPSGREAFLKAFDFQSLFEEAEATGADLLNEIQRALAIYNYEKNILVKCRERRLSNVALSLGHGDIEVTTTTYSAPLNRVFYIVFDKAQGDIREELAATNHEPVWFLRAMHEVAIGLRQLHAIEIAHQDLKPSNVFLFGGKRKVGDLGRATDRGAPSPLEELPVSGDPAYAPPEHLYRSVSADWRIRRFGCDSYLLGSFLYFLFSRASLTESLLSRIYGGYHHIVWTGTFAEVLPYLEQAFGEVLPEFEADVTAALGGYEDGVFRIVRMLKELACPDPARRGRPGSRYFGNPFDLETYVSELDLVSRRLDLHLRLAASKRNRQ